MTYKIIRKVTIDICKQEVDDVLADIQKRYKLIQVIDYVEKDPTTVVLILLVEKLQE